MSSSQPFNASPARSAQFPDLKICPRRSNLREIGALALVLFLFSCPTNAFAQGLSGEYLMTAATGANRTLYLNSKDLLLGQKRGGAADAGEVSFFLKPVAGEYYEIRVGNANGPRLHENGNGDKLLSARWSVNDNYTKFKLLKQSDGTYKVRTKATGRYWHLDGNGDKLVSTRYQPDDVYNRFRFSKPPVSLFKEQYAVPGQQMWSRANSENAAAHEKTVTVTRAKPVAVEMKLGGTAESEKYGTQVRLIDMNKAPELRGSRLVLEDQRTQADGKLQSKVLFDFRGHVAKRDGRTLLLLQDLSSFQTEAYTKTDHFVGPFLEKIDIKYSGVPGWGYPSISPLSQNASGNYSQSTTIGADLSVGFQGQTPGGSLGASFSQTESSSTNVPDIVFTQKTSNSAPIFTWTLGNVYASTKELSAYNGNPWNIVRKQAGQIAVDRSVMDAAPLARGTFQIATHCAYTNFTQRDLSSFKVRLDYEVTYRAVFSDPQKFQNDAAAFGHGFAFIFGLDPNMYSGQTFRSWGTVKVVHKFPVEITVPASALNSSW